MKLTLNTIYAGPDPADAARSVCFQPGEEVEFSKGQAKELLAGGYAYDAVARKAAEDAAKKKELDEKRVADKKAAEETASAQGG